VGYGTAVSLPAITEAPVDRAPDELWTRRWGWARLPGPTPALLGYVAVRAVCLLILWKFVDLHGGDYWHLLSSRFDAGWYEQIADHGYNAVIPRLADGTPRPSNLAFFPFYPGLIWLVMAVTPFSSAAAGLIVAWLFALAGAWAMYEIGNHLHGRTTGVLLAMLYGVLPHAVVENMAYSEPVYTALAAWTLYALLRARWLEAGVLSILAGLCRPTASAVVATVGLCALVAIVRRRDGWRPWAALVLAPLGYLGYLWWVGERLGRLDGYFYMMKTAWQVEFDGGAATWQTVRDVLTKPQSLNFYVITALLAVAVVLLVKLFLDRYPLAILAYTALTVLFVIGAGGPAFYGKGRYLLPAFTLLLPVAAALARARLSTRILVLCLLTAISGWYGAYLLTVWLSSP
jgi:hypothetical protein